MADNLTDNGRFESLILTCQAGSGRLCLLQVATSMDHGICLCCLDTRPGAGAATGSVSITKYRNDYEQPCAGMPINYIMDNDNLYRTRIRHLNFQIFVF